MCLVPYELLLPSLLVLAGGWRVVRAWWLAAGLRQSSLVCRPPTATGGRSRVFSLHVSSLPPSPASAFRDLRPLQSSWTVPSVYCRKTLSWRRPSPPTSSTLIRLYQHAEYQKTMLCFRADRSRRVWSSTEKIKLVIRDETGVEPSVLAAFRRGTRPDQRGSARLARPPAAAAGRSRVLKFVLRLPGPLQ